jgi:hypothetical protein
MRSAPSLDPPQPTVLHHLFKERQTAITLDRLRHEIKDKVTRIGVHEAHVADLNSRLQKSQRDATTSDEKVSHITIELQTTKTRKQYELSTYRPITS